MNPMNKVGQVRISSPLFSGLLYAFILMGIGTIIASLVLLLSSQKEDSLSTVAYAIHAFSLFIGGWVAGKRSGYKGWYFGGVMGTLYTIIIMIIGFLGFDQGLNLKSLLLLACGFIIAAAGGMLGVNTKQR